KPGKLAAVRKRPGGVDLPAEPVLDAQPIDAFLDPLPLAQAAKTLAPAADRIEALQCEPWGIDRLVAGAATLDIAMPVQQFPQCLRSADVRFDPGDPRRWRLRHVPQKPLHHPDPAGDR